MSFVARALEAQAPAKQSATETINTLCSRLTNATLLEDRRAAILGLRSFAKEYPASVASGSLRGLISALTKDAEDVDTTKVVMETLLMLYNPDENSPEASEDISLWMADEFTQRQDNITLLLDRLEGTDFYSRRYSLKLLKSISNLRPERTQECILSAPLGLPRLVAVLDDPRDPVREAALDLLIDLTQSSMELQKIVAFQNAFEKIFNLIEADGSIRQGATTVQDSLALTANLIQYNASNQLAFRESGCVPKLAKLLSEGVRTPKPTTPGEQVWESPDKERNLYGLLGVLRMFLVNGSMGTPANQDAFQRHGMLQLALDLSFDNSASVHIRAQALYTCADMIRGNPGLQRVLGGSQVSFSANNNNSGEALQNGDSRIPVIEALLHMILESPTFPMFDARFAACECLKAYFYKNLETGPHFLGYAIQVHEGEEEDPVNVLTTLIKGPQVMQTGDSYRFWFASVIIFHLIFENTKFEDREAKRELMNVVEGNAEAGEDVVTCIQFMASNLIAALDRGEDERVTIGYLMVLCGWLFECADAVNDFLVEGSSFIPSLIRAAARTTTDQPIVRGLCAVLLGIIYEFSTKDSPEPFTRRKLQPVLLNELGRERYLDAIRQLRTHPLVRDFEVLPASAMPGSAPEVYFDTTFVDFLKDNFSRLSRAIDRDPGLEIVQQEAQGVDRDLVDSLRGELDQKIQALEKAKSDLLAMERHLNEEQAGHRKTQETSASELSRIRQINEGLHREHEADATKRDANHRAKIEGLENQHRQQLASINAQMEQRAREATGHAARSKEQTDREIAQLKRARTELEERSRKAETSLEAATKQLNELQSKHEHMTADLTSSQNQTKTLEERAQNAESSLEATSKQLKDLELRHSQTSADLSERDEKEEARGAAQQELDDMLMVLADLEEKRGRDKRRLRELGEEVSEGEDDDEEEEDEEDEK
ncbi:intracellular protein transporter [Saccharata proteae CBS 121410]|uniref:Intracellular protein transporter n=1 Tax=Saccharata proteae CBS 121410 TaxID=1314787 RepID=A0A9P4M3N1_9PEZI|nr:intracellular protein transporter [Saccharata proteae CBS 121410]